MVDVDGSVSLTHLEELLDDKIREVSRLREMLMNELSQLTQSKQNHIDLRQALKYLDFGDLKDHVKKILEDHHTHNLAAVILLQQKYDQAFSMIHSSYRSEIQELQVELQKQYRLTRAMKVEVEDLKSLVESFIKEKQQKQKVEKPEEPITPPLTIAHIIKNSNPTLEIITQEDENQSTKRDPQELESPHLDRPRISIKEYITLECLQNKLKSQQEEIHDLSSPKFHSESHKLLACDEIDLSSPAISNPNREVSHSSIVSTSNRKPAKFFLEEFKKSFQKTLSENSLERKDCLTSSSGLEQQQLFSLEDSSKKFDSNNSTPTNSQLFAKVTFGKQKKFFSQIDQSQNEMEDLMREPSTIQKQPFMSRQRNTTRSKQRQPLCQKNNEETPARNSSYLLNHVKKKLNYNSMSNNTKQRENSYSSRQKTNNTASSREDRYKLLIRNILNIKEKQNHTGSSALSKEKKKQPSQSSCQLIPNVLFVGDKKMEIKYDGAKREGKRHGRGTLYYSNGLSYEGEFRDGVRCGYGILKFNHIEIYNGDWLNDMLNGQGRIKNCAVVSKKKRQPCSGNGPQLHRWISYSGEFRQNKFHGTGTLFLQNGEKFLGKFSHGVAQGQGTYYKSNGQVEFGICRNNVFSQKF